MSNQAAKKSIHVIAFEITHGDISSAEYSPCPQCGEHHLVFSFTHNRPARFGLFIDCGSCGSLNHFSLSSKPPNFREDLVLDKYQKMENEAKDFANDLSDIE